MDPDQLLKELEEQGWSPTDTDDEFPAFHGEYLATVHAVKRQSGTNQKGEPYDFISVQAQVNDDGTHSGDKANGRYINGLTYPLTQKWGLPEFCNQAWKCGVEVDRKNGIDAFIESAQQLVGKEVKVKTYANKGFENAKIIKVFKDEKVSEATTF